jgi:hypothetical protein
MTIAAAPVATHVAELDRMLRGPGALQRSMLAEVHDGLHNAAEAYRAAGLDPRRAAATAGQDFGAAGEVAPLMQEELTARQGHSTLLLVAVTFPAMIHGWDLLWMSGAGGLWSSAPTHATPSIRRQDLSRMAATIPP